VRRLALDEAVRRAWRSLLQTDGTAAPSDLHAVLISAVERPLIEVVPSGRAAIRVKAAEMLGINRNTLRRRLPSSASRYRAAVVRGDPAPAALCDRGPRERAGTRFELARSLLAGGARLVQLRLKGRTSRDTHAAAERIAHSPAPRARSSW